jgi:Asp-tRNA(Asn)/Glu-tRNA(Gln) amidotransferase B subunit
MNQFATAGVDPATVDPAELAKVIEARDRLPRPTFLEALAASGRPGFSADDYLAEAAVSAVDELEPLVERVLAENPKQVESYRSGKEGVLGFFVGQVMRETQGKADAKVVNALLREKLRA